MRIRVVGLLICLVVVATTWMTNAPWPRRLTAYLMGGRNQAAAMNVDTFPVYLTDTRKWLTFPVAADARRLRVLVNVIVPSETAAADADQPVPTNYDVVVEYRLHSEGRPIAGARHLQSHVPRFRRADGSTYCDSFLRLTPGQPLATREFLIDLTQLDKRPRSFSLRLVPAPDSPATAAVRLFRQTNRHPRELAYAWRRMSDEHKRRLARASVYEPELLTSKERMNLLRTIWSPVAPSGSRDDAYRQDTLFRLKDHPGEAVRPPTPPDGCWLPANGRLAITLPEVHGTIRIHAVPWDVGELPVRTADSPRFETQWFHADSTAGPIEHRQLVNQECRLPVAGNTLELRAKSSMCIRCYWLPAIEADAGDAQEIDVTPALTRTRMYRAERDHPVRFPVTHVDGQPTPVRLSLRRQAASQPGHHERLVVHWRMLDEFGQVVGTDVCTLDSTVSDYDRLPEPGPDSAITDPVQLYLLAPPETVNLEVTAPAPCLVGLASRPFDLPYSPQPPQKPDDGATGSSPAVARAWFSLRPGAQTDRDEQRTVDILIGPRPPETTEPDNGWAQPAPQFEWICRQVLLPLSDAQQNRLLSGQTHDTGDAHQEYELPETVFAEITAGQPFNYEPLPTAAGRSIRPHLLFQIAAQQTTGSMRLFADDRLVDVLKLHGSWGEVQPELTAESPARIMVEAPGVERLLISGGKVAGRPLYRRRLAYRLASQPLRFTIPPRPAQQRTISIRVLNPERLPETAQLRIRVIGPPAPVGTALKSFTLRNRVVSLPAMIENVALVQRGGLHPCPVTAPLITELQSDLAGAHCELEVELLGSNAALIIVSVEDDSTVAPPVYLESIPTNIHSPAGPRGSLHE